MLQRFKGRLSRGGSSPYSTDDARALALNYSFVYHERSDSLTVRRAVASRMSGGRSNGMQAVKRPDFSMVLNRDALADVRPDIILTTSIGEPAGLKDLADRLPVPPAIVFVDGPGPTLIEQEFFRAPGELVLPEIEAERLCVAAVVHRPGRRQFELVAIGPFRWPEAAPAVMTALERLVLYHVDQWSPGRAIWPCPAETLIPEVCGALESGSTDAR